MTKNLDHRALSPYRYCAADTGGHLLSTKTCFWNLECLRTNHNIFNPTCIPYEALSRNSLGTFRARVSSIVHTCTVFAQYMAVQNHGSCAMLKARPTGGDEPPWARNQDRRRSLFFLTSFPRFRPLQSAIGSPSRACQAFIGPAENVGCGWWHVCYASLATPCLPMWFLLL